jgi:S-adenosylmethionine decarboxylase
MTFHQRGQQSRDAPAPATCSHIIGGAAAALCCALAALLTVVSPFTGRVHGYRDRATRRRRPATASHCLTDQSLHILADLTTRNLARLLDVDSFLTAVDDIVGRSGATQLGRVAHTFDGGGGYTVVVCLAESHVAVHTWPELERVTLDVYLCNYARDNTARCRAIYAALESYFQPERATVKEVLR